MKNDKHPFKAGMAWALFRVCYEAGLQYYDPEEPGDWYPEPEKGWEAFIGLDETRHGFRRKLTKEVDGHPQEYTQRFLVDLFIDVNGEADEELADYPDNEFFNQLVAKAEALFQSELASGQQELYETIFDMARGGTPSLNYEVELYQTVLARLLNMATPEQRKALAAWIMDVAFTDPEGELAELMSYDGWPDGTKERLEGVVGGVE